jgi:hypothetical protein
MAGSINVNQNNNNVNIQDQNGRLTITDNNRGTTTNVTQPVTNVVTVSAIGPQGPQGPIGPIPSSGSFTGAFTGSFSGSFTGSLQGTASNAVSASYALTASYLQGYISPFPFTGSARITGSLGVTGSISTITQFYHPDSLDSSNRILIDGSSNLSINWNNRTLGGIDGSETLNWNDFDNITGITTIPISEQLDQKRIDDQLASQTLIANGKIVADQTIEQDARINGTIVYYNENSVEWLRLENSVIINSENPIDNILGIVIDQGRGNILLQGNITFQVTTGGAQTLGFPPIVGSIRNGYPLYLAYGGPGGYTDPVAFSTEIPDGTAVRSMGHILQSVTDGIYINGIISFNPSNDYFRKISGISRIDQINGQGIYAQYAVTADQAVSSSFATSASFASTASFVRNAVSASYVLQAVSASFASTASFIQSKTVFNQPILGTGNIGFVTRSFTQGPNVTGTTSEVQIFQLLIPSNTFSATDKLTFFAVFNRPTPAGTVSLRAKMSTSSSMPSGNTSLIARLNPTATQLYSKMARDLIISDGNIKGFNNNSTANNDVANSTAAMSSQSLDVTVDNYFYLSVQPATGSEEIRLEAVEIKNI